MIDARTIISVRLSLSSLVLCFALWFCATPASAQTCTFTAGTLNFGSPQLSGGGAIDATATIQASCSGGSSRTIYVCANMGEGGGGGDSTGSRRMRFGTQTLNYQIYSNSGRTTVWGSSLWPNAPTPPKFSVPRGGSTTMTLYGRILANQRGTEAGLYTSNFSGNHFDFRVGKSTQSCSSSYGNSAANQPVLDVLVNVQPGCTMAITDIDFGARGLLDTAVVANGAVRLTCASGTSYFVDLVVPSGETAASRLMYKGGDTIAYGLYKDAAFSQPWGDTGSQRLSATSAGALQTFTVYGRVPAQTVPATGEYTDTVIVNVTY